MLRKGLYVPLSSVCGGPDRVLICALCGRPPQEECPRGKTEDRFLIDESELRRRLREEYKRGYQDGEKIQ